MPPTNRRRYLLILSLVAYFAIVAAATISGNPVFAAAATLLLLTLLLAPALAHGRPVAWLLWVALTALGMFATVRGHGALVFDAVPVLINFALAVFFGLTLRQQREPLIARAIVAMEGAERLALPGVAAYARWLTVAWTALFVVQTTLLLIVFLCRSPGGALALIGWPLPLVLPAGFAEAYLRFGGYLVTLAFFIVEYAFRRWKLRHLPHASAQGFARNLAANWSRIVNGRVPTAGVDAIDNGQRDNNR